MAGILLIFNLISDAISETESIVNFLSFQCTSSYPETESDMKVYQFKFCFKI